MNNELQHNKVELRKVNKYTVKMIAMVEKFELNFNLKLKLLQIKTVEMLITF